MKKILFVLVALVFAAPTWAAVDITATDLGGGDVLISFDATSEPNLPRAFALDIRCDNDANIVAVVPHMVGVCTDIQQGYGIFPGTIQINAEGTVTDDGTPVAPSGDPDALPGIDSNGVTIELGSLYAPVASPANAPDPCGPLVTLTVDKATCLTITANITRAGSSGVVMESPDEVVTVNLPPELCVVLEVDCMKESNPAWNDWVAWGKPDCWCYARQCRGDIDGMKYGPFWVQVVDLDRFKAAFNKIDTALPPGGICADLDHTKYGPFRVQVVDLDIFKAYFNKIESLVPECDPTHYNMPWKTP
jgi:uncharacterized Zn-binding protein involved in type VI secretion